jgi:aminopeptidase
MYGPIDARDMKLAEVLIDHSTRPRKGEVVIVHGVGLDTLGLCSAVMRVAQDRGAVPVLKLEEPQVQREMVANGTEAMWRKYADFELKAMKQAKCYVGIRGSDNIFEMSGLPKEKMQIFNTLFVKPVHFEQRVKHTRWVVLRYPNSAMAQLAQMPRSTFADFYYTACCLDYAHMDRAVKPLKELMEKTKKVQLRGGGTDLTFSIEGIPAIPCTGSHNIPDGECFTAPVKDSINGVVQFNAPTVYEGSPFDAVRLEFKKGKVVKATAGSDAQTRRLNEILDQDDGARHVGEFAIGFHPFVLTPMRDILFDEKIAGSIHMALGQAYEDADNTNRSAIHWDLVQIMRPEYGGGEILFDGKVIRKDGIFTVPELKGLNPDAYGNK